MLFDSTRPFQLFVNTPATRISPPGLLQEAIILSYAKDIRTEYILVTNCNSPAAKVLNMSFSKAKDPASPSWPSGKSMGWSRRTEAGMAFLQLGKGFSAENIVKKKGFEMFFYHLNWLKNVKFHC